MHVNMLPPRLQLKDESMREHGGMLMIEVDYTNFVPQRPGVKSHPFLSNVLTVDFLSKLRAEFSKCSARGFVNRLVFSFACVSAGWTAQWWLPWVLGGTV